MPSPAAFKVSPLAGQKLLVAVVEAAQKRLENCPAARYVLGEHGERAGQVQTGSREQRLDAYRAIRDRLPQGADPGLVDWFLDEAAKNDPEYIGKFVLLMASYDWSGEVERIRVPTLVVIPGAETVGTVANYDLSVVPLFILMGCLAANTNLSRDLFQGINALFGRVRGELAEDAVELGGIHFIGCQQRGVGGGEVRGLGHG